MMKFLNPMGFLALLGIPLVVFLYLLKQKYKEQSVSSLFLWKRTLVVSQANEPWQKLKKNLLLFLQILAIILLALALANPYGLFEKKTTNYVMVLDCSMSMQGTDESPTRFEKAKESIINFVEEVPPGTGMTLVMLGKSPYLAVNHSTEKREIQQALSHQNVENGEANWKMARELIAMTTKQQKAQVILFTDHPYETGELQAKQMMFGKAGENCGITLFSHKIEEGNVQSFAKIKNFGTTAVKKTVTLFADEAVAEVKEVNLEAGQEQNVVFSEISSQSHQLRVTLSPEDMLPPDDVAFDVVHQKSTQKVLLVSDGNVFLEKVFRLFPEVELYQTKPENAENLTGYAWYVFDGVVPSSFPQDGYCLFLNPPKDNGVVSLGTPSQGVTVTGALQEQLPFMKNVKFDLTGGNPIETPSWAWNLLESQGNVYGIAGEYAGKKMVWLSFDLNQSDFPLKKEFPIFWYELLNWYFPNVQHSMKNGVAGEEQSLALEPKTKEAVVQMPLGKQITVAPPFPPQNFANTQETGFYTLVQTGEDDSTQTTSFAVNAKTEGESDCSQTYDNVESSENKKWTVTSGGSLRNMVLLFLLGLLMIEWWVNCREY